MSEYLIQDTTMNGLATAIHEKAGITTAMTPDDLIATVYSLETPTQTGAPTYGVTFYDYDGTVLYSYSVMEARALTALPEGPIHDGVTFSGWTHTLEDVTSIYKGLDVGATYTSDTTKFVMEIEIDNTTIPLYFQASEVGGASIDWGDGSSDVNTVTTFSSISHTYSTAGTYTITLSTLSGEVQIGRKDEALLFGSIENASLLKSAILGNNITIYGNLSYSGVFRECSNLQTVMLCRQSSDYYSLSDMFWFCKSLEFVIWSYNCVSESMFYGCHSLSKVIFDRNSYAQYTSYTRYAEMFRGCKQLKTLELPAKIQCIGALCFRQCSINTLYIRATTPPKLQDISAFRDENYNYYVSKIYVPIESLDSYKTSENWSLIKNRIYGTVF